MRKKYNDSSKYFKDWTTKQLKRYALSLYDCIWGEQSCYNCKDIMMYDGIMLELDKRGVTGREVLTF